MKEYDVLIIGAGPAGLTAGIYSARNGMKTAIVAKEIGGTANSILRIENWPGYSGTGAELVKKFYEHSKKYEIDFVVSEVDSIKKEKDLFVVKTKDNEIKSKSIIIASGTDRNKLYIEGEKEFLGKGVSYCSTCDAFFFKNKIVAVIGGSDCASGSALVLSEIAKKVYVIYRGEKLRCEDINSKRLEEKSNVEIIYNAMPTKISGKEKAEELDILKDKKIQKLKIDGIFIEIGSTPVATFTKDLKLKINNEKFIEVNDNMETSVKGVFACGDVTNFKLKQVLIASAHGAIAAKNASDWVENKT
jgi:thioredoxin reductase (NADPH)